jgi:hypothetical protein
MRHPGSVMPQEIAYTRIRNGELSSKPFLLVCG